MSPKLIIMKKGIFWLVFITFSVFSYAQTKPASKKVATGTNKQAKPSQPVPVMKNALDSFSYALGLSMAAFYKEQGVENINATLVNKALKDAKTGKPVLDESQINECIISYIQELKSVKAGPYKKEGQAYLDSNKTQHGIVVLPSGLQYRIMKVGTGPKPGPTDKVKVHYQGALTTGKIFDSSIERGEPISLNVNEVIPGWIEALQMMPAGSKWQLFIPSDLGYGDAGQGPIPPGSTLVFEVELIEIVKQ